MQLTSIPLTAWDQAGIVCLFAVVIITLFYAVNKMLNAQRTAQLASQKELLKQQQEFIETRDLQWQGFLREQREADNVTSEKLVSVIDKLVDRVENLEAKFDQHDAKEMEFIRGVADRKTPPRRGND